MDRLGRSPLSILYRTPVLVLHTRGRSTGRPRATPLAHHRDPDGSFLVVGGAAGQARIPDWVANLRTRPDQAEITVDRRRSPVRVEELDDHERNRIWPELRARWPRIETYRLRAGRDIPVFRFVPSGTPPRPARSDPGGATDSTRPQR